MLYTKFIKQTTHMDFQEFNSKMSELERIEAERERSGQTLFDDMFGG